MLATVVAPSHALHLRLGSEQLQDALCLHGAAERVEARLGRLKARAALGGVWGRPGSAAGSSNGRA